MYTFEAGAKLVTPFIIGTGNGKPRLELLYSTQPVAALVGRELNLKRTKMHNDHFFVLVGTHLELFLYSATLAHAHTDGISKENTPYISSST